MKKSLLIITALFLTVGIYGQSKYSIVNKYVKEKYVKVDTIQQDSMSVTIEGPSSMIVSDVEAPSEFAVTKILTDFLDYFMSDQAFGLLDKFLNGGQCSKDRKFYEQIGKDYIKFLVEHHQDSTPPAGGGK